MFLVRANGAFSLVLLTAHYLLQPERRQKLLILYYCGLFIQLHHLSYLKYLSWSPQPALCFHVISIPAHFCIV